MLDVDTVEVLEVDQWLALLIIEDLDPFTTAPSPPTSPLYVAVDDLEGTLERAARLGAMLGRRRTELGGDDRWFGTVIDPSGVSFGLWTAQPTRPGGPTRPQVDG